jgi:hypothetical protein
MSVNLAQSAKKILIDLINQDNGTTLVESALTFGVPAAHAGAKNTVVQATATPDAGYTGTINVFYNRINLALIPGTRSKIFTVGTNVNLVDLIPAINARYLINLTPDDYINIALPVFSGATPNQLLDFNVTIKSTSLIYFGTLILQLRRADISLTTIITDTTLSDLDF